ncbi:iron complex outermembrane receptor protein [Paraburkholderia caballeronis]|uniref:TonB-dependent siderophore receptor n=1 Tax=Paraburkholderia caballeronis TaxID=416943 RepID=UPI0010F15D12|nr:TonB-dependent siderophore receptor [Paraburkholderia caballeronis]TDV25542.1 iron complex outermembrane receptor protein [Paraburkholderia caballeronis]
MTRRHSRRHPAALRDDRRPPQPPKRRMPPSRPRKIALASLGASLALAAAVAPTALAFAADAGSNPASAAARQTWRVPAGPLDAALSDFASQAGVSIQMDARLVEGLRSPGLNGAFTVNEGFAALVAGTGVEVVESSSGVHLVRTRTAAPRAQPDSQSGQQLPTVHVSAQSNPYGDTDGYVAFSGRAAAKTDTPLIETPQSISVVTRDQLTQQNAQTLNAAVRYTSGVTAESRGGTATRYDLLKIRGFDADTYWNGLKLIGNGMYSVPQLDPYLMERIEVLKGPVSVLYGQAAAGGVIDQESRLPTPQAQHEIGVQFGNYGHKQTTFDFSGPLDADAHYLYRLTGLARSEDGQVNTTRNERIAIAPSFTWRPDERTSLTLYALFQRDPRSTSYGSVPPEGTVLFDPYGKLPADFYDGDTAFERFSRTQASVGYQFEHKLDRNWTVRTNGRFFHIGQDYASVYGSGVESDYRTLDRYSIASTDNMNTVALDNQVEGKFATGPLAHTLLAGFDYQHMASSYRLGYGSAPPLDLYAPDYDQPIADPARTLTQVSSNQYGVYAQDQMRLGRFVFTLGGREDWTSTTTRVEGSGPTDQSARAFTKRAGLTYVFDNGIAPYASYTESFSPQSGTDASGHPFDPERARQYEVGVKYQPTRWDALFTLAWFDLKRKNLLTPDANNPAFQSQVGEARSRGVELEAKASVTDSVNVAASYTYLDTKYIRDNSGLQGKFIAGVPQNQASLWAYYTQQRGPLAGLSFGAGARYTGQTYSYDNTYKLSSFLLVDATLRYDLGRVSSRLKGSDLYVNAQNLLNKHYVASCYYTTWCAFGYGRQVFAGANYRW